MLIYFYSPINEFTMMVNKKQCLFGIKKPVLIWNTTRRIFLSNRGFMGLFTMASASWPQLRYSAAQKNCRAGGSFLRCCVAVMTIRIAFICVWMIVSRRMVPSGIYISPLLWRGLPAFLFRSEKQFSVRCPVLCGSEPGRIPQPGSRPDIHAPVRCLESPDRWY